MASFLRRQRAAGAEPPLEGAPRQRPHAGLLRRERRTLLQARESLLRDLGGLMVEMYRRDDYRDDLLAEACADILAVDDRVAEIDELLGARRGAPHCTCGAPILAGSHFCPNCGRDLTQGAAGDGADSVLRAHRTEEA
jgi:hypothetical protein